ncbi:sensor histidine kinase [Streptomyces meridianus]|uniref:histidine kinase n=1 Tax=Streptomyces meridianus TaxID=2938945 RepID=A0ABT0XB98_9ACTN|nr:sensor histidine kinase [Streptomyces meridianus]MCM2579787.1 sensor histidine kinase [Streptomyces meridianus]
MSAGEGPDGRPADGLRAPHGAGSPGSRPWHGLDRGAGLLPRGFRGGRTSLPWLSSLVVAVVQLAGSQFAAVNQPDRMPLDVWARLLLLAGPALLPVRYRRPRLTVFGTSAVALGYLAAGYPYGPVVLSVVVAVFAAVASGHRLAAWSAVGLLWAGHLLAVQVFHRWPASESDGHSPWTQQLVVAAWVVAVLAASELVRVRHERFARERAERERAERRRAAEERLRIARELHDVLAHSISLIHVQAGVGLALLDSRPEQARSALTTIKEVSREALGEVRQVLDTLRATGDAPRSPAPGLDRLPELAEQAGRAGLSVEVREHGTRHGLPSGVDLAAFRIIQEALTNIVRHSGARTARVGLDHGPEALEIRVDDDGPATAPEHLTGGNGLAGMRERAAALGGGVEAGPRPGGGFRVLARLPLRPDATAARTPRDREEEQP